MLVWIGIGLAYGLVVTRLVQAVLRTNSTSSIASGEVPKSVTAAAALMLDQQIVSIRATSDQCGFQFRKSITQDGLFILEALIPCCGPSEEISKLFAAIGPQIGIEKCIGSTRAESVAIIDISEAKNLVILMDILEKKWSVAAGVKYAISKPYLLDASENFEEKILRFSTRCFFEKPIPICDLIVPVSGKLFVAHREPQVHVMRPYLLELAAISDRDDIDA